MGVSAVRQQYYRNCKRRSNTVATCDNRPTQTGNAPQYFAAVGQALRREGYFYRCRSVATGADQLPTAFAVAL